jgi:hypothetical protein
MTALYWRAGAKGSSGHATLRRVDQLHGSSFELADRCVPESLRAGM